MEKELKLGKLRLRAEEFLKDHKNNLIDDLSETTINLVEELTIHQIELEMQNDELMKAYDEISLLKEKFEDLYEFVPVGYLLIDSKGIIQEANLSACKMFNQSRNSLQGSRFELLVPEKNRDQVFKFINDIFSSNLKCTCELSMCCQDSGLFYGQLDGIGISNSDRTTDSARIAITDISERVNAEKRLRVSLNEKEVLLKEVHHRVKNNMQIIESLLKMQASQTKDDRLNLAFLESKDRIAAMAIVHETLYRSDNLSSINARSYVSKLVESIQSSRFESAARIKLSLNIDPIEMDLDRCNPLGLVLNELLSNSLKHGFPDDRAGEIIISLIQLDKNNVELTISDDGIGMPDGFEWRKSNTLGLRLVKDLIEIQLDGSIVLDNTNGSKFTITFNL